MTIGHQPKNTLHKLIVSYSFICIQATSAARLSSLYLLASEPPPWGPLSVNLPVRSGSYTTCLGPRGGQSMTSYLQKTVPSVMSPLIMRQTCVYNTNSLGWPKLTWSRPSCLVPSVNRTLICWGLLGLKPHPMLPITSLESSRLE